MHLDAVSRVAEVEDVLAADTSVRKAPVFEPWADWPPSEISHHGMICCQIAREWLNATDYALLGGGHILTGPRWLCYRFKWGPSAFPIYWCEAVRKKMLDCGALAALSHQVLSARGVRCSRVQFVQRFSKMATAQWSSGWAKVGVPINWINDDLIYHEGVAVVTGKMQIKIWDSSAGWWVEPRTTDGYGSAIAIRVFAHEKNGELKWSGRILKADRWINLID